MIQNNTLQKIGERIAFYRNKKGFSQQKLAEATGLSQGTISQIEQGKRKNLTLRNLERIAAALGIETGNLYPLLNSGRDSVFHNIEPDFYKILDRLALQEKEKQQKLAAFFEKTLDLLNV